MCCGILRKLLNRKTTWKLYRISMKDAVVMHELFLECDNYDIAVNYLHMKARSIKYNNEVIYPYDKLIIIKIVGNKEYVENCEIYL